MDHHIRSEGNDVLDGGGQQLADAWSNHRPERWGQRPGEMPWSWMNCAKSR
ncbi:hypothetical protein [Pseudarthrobacter sp. AL20]|uniref:hypothetical protein n=1 Tax=Pseudarthrobacter sp. AL20 TaxID=3042239 RepID=UPI00249BDBA6|nr:hypothetical protein [Pseudarthrobacter sp. AL20]